jgi:TonB family protein
LPIRSVNPFSDLRCMLRRRHGAAIWMLCGLGAPAWAADGVALASAGDVRSAATPDAPEKLHDFDIPAQPLDAALKRYATVSGWPILFPSAMVAGRISSAVRGSYSPQAALGRLLDGTGLAAEKVDTGPSDTFVLKQIDAAAPPSRPAAGGVDFDYGGWVQARVRAALCTDPRTAAENYRALLRFEIDASGAIQQARLLNSTGNAARDAALLETLQSVHVERAPPPDMAQPLTMIILPAQAGAGPGCADSNIGKQAARP